MKRTDVTTQITAREIQDILQQDISKSKKIVQLFDGGVDVTNIAKLLGIRYNFAYNVIQNHVNVHDVAVEKTQKDSMRQPVLDLLAQGKKIVEIARITKMNYNYVWKIAQEGGFTGKDKKEPAVPTQEAKTEAQAPAPRSHNKTKATAEVK